MPLLLALACHPIYYGDGVPVPTADVDACEGTTCGCAADLDGDFWLSADDGGHDCDDEDPLVGECDAEADDVAACEPTGPELCNGRDDDCDGLVDDAVLVRWLAEAAVVVAGALRPEGEAVMVVGKSSSLPGVDGVVDIVSLEGYLIVRIEGVDQSPSFGSQLATGRDLTGDGIDDLVVSAPFAETADGANSGRVLVFAGPIRTWTEVIDAEGWFEGGELDGQPGGQLALLPDLNGDGLAELAIGYYRHTLLFSGAPRPGARRADAWLDLELNTGGGAWHYASAPDQDGDGRPELLVGMDTYASGVGFVGTVLSGSPTGFASVTSDPAWPGLGSKLVVVDGVTWSLSGTTPVRLDTWTSLPITATQLANGGDLDGDGHDDLLVETPEGILAPFLDTALVAGRLQPERTGSAGSDLDGDGVADLRILIEGGAALASGAAALLGSCDSDGDGTSTAAGDCDDDDPSRYPGAHETCDGLDGDCDGAVDVPAEVRLIDPQEAAPVDVVLLGVEDPFAGDGAVLSVSGAAEGFGAWSGTSVSGLFSIGYGGDLKGIGTVTLLGHAEAADLVLLAGTSGAALDLAEARISNGALLLRTGQMGTPGDLDGDGADDLLVGSVTETGALAAAVFAGPVTADRSLDSADWLVNLPDGWSGVSYGLLHGPGEADVTGDGLADLLAGSASSYNGGGRVTVLSGLPAGVLDSDDIGILQVYGEPGDALGSTLAVGGDLDGDGVGDALMGSSQGPRVLRGASCPIPQAPVEGPTVGLSLIDLDGDGIAASLASADGWLWYAGEAWREATALWGAGPLGVAWADDHGTWISRPECP